MACWIDEKTLDDLPDTGSAPLRDREAVLDFVRTPLAVRCNIVKVWRPLPRDLWSALTQPNDIRKSRQRERRAVVAVAVMVALLVFGDLERRVSPGHHGSGDDISADWRLIYSRQWLTRIARLVLRAGAVAGTCAVGGGAAPGRAGRSFACCGSPGSAAGKSSGQATFAMVRHLSGTYLYVYLMVFVGAALMLPLVRLAPAETQILRWYLWCFLFGETFFVPAVMWLRLILSDRSGQVFGHWRYSLLAAYGVGVVAIPIWGMLIVFW